MERVFDKKNIIKKCWSITKKTHLKFDDNIT